MTVVKKALGYKVHAAGSWLQYLTKAKENICELPNQKPLLKWR